MKVFIGIVAVLAIAAVIFAVPGIANEEGDAMATSNEQVMMESPVVEEQPNIVETAIAVNSEGMYAGSFDTLIAAVTVADPAVMQTLTGTGQYTVFAPTDDAFEELGITADMVADLDRDELTAILLYHVANGKRMATDVISSEQIRMINTEFVAQEAGVLTDNNDGEVNIIVTDVEASNGVIHVIDRVLLPTQEETQEAPMTTQANIVETAIAVNSEGMYAGAFDTLIAAVQAADPAVIATLTGKPKHTVFAPTDDAFSALGLDADNIGEVDQATLTSILLNHVALGNRPAESVVGSEQIRMINGERLAQEAGVLTDNTGGKANIIVTDVAASNGMIHVIDQVLMPIPAQEKSMQEQSIIDVAIAVNSEGMYAGSFDTLIAALQAANPSVINTLNGNGFEFTVFAPTDEAFAQLNLNPENVASLGKKELTNILWYHVVSGTQMAQEVIATDRFRMMNHGYVYQEGGVLTDANMGEANIIVTDVQAANGVIHAIDKVLLP